MEALEGPFKTPRRFLSFSLSQLIEFLFLSHISFFFIFFIFVFSDFEECTSNLLSFSWKGALSFDIGYAFIGPQPWET